VTALTPPRRSYDLGFTSWGPLPGTDLHIQWDGPANPLFLVQGNPGWFARNRAQVRHPAGDGLYVTAGQAERAVRELTAVWLAAQPENQPEGVPHVR
jgi:hypothetical protein